MPNAIKYSVSTQTLALKKGNFWIGTGDVSKGTTGNTDYWNGITPPVGGYTIYLNKASQGPAIFVAANDAALITITNRIAGTSYTNVTECLSWFSTQNDKMVLNEDYEVLTTNGLILNYNPSKVLSYPRTGTTFYDNSANGYNGIIYNSPSWNSNGWFTYDGVDDVIETSQTFQFSKTSQFSVSGIIKIQSHTFREAAAAGIIGKGHWYSNTWDIWLHNNHSIYFETSGDNNPSNWRALSSAPLTVGRWYFFTATYNNGIKKLYLNTSVTTETYTGTGGFENNNTVQIARRYGDSSRSLIGNSVYFSIYDRELSVSEILQNYYKGSIVTTGLVFAVDAGNIVSYEPGSTNAYDLTDNVAVGSLNNGTYGSGNWFIFDGSNDDISFPHDADYKNQSLSVDFWVNLDFESTGRHVMFTTWYGFTVEVNNPGGSLAWGLNGLPGQYMTAGTITYGNTTHIACTYNPTTNVQNIYINGSLVGTQIVDGTINYSSDSLLFSGSWDRTKGKMGSMKIYNKDLSASEVSKNFNAERARFGL